MTEYTAAVVEYTTYDYIDVVEEKNTVTIVQIGVVAVVADFSLIGVLLPSYRKYPLSFLGAYHILYNPFLHGQQSDKNYKTSLQVSILPFGDFNTPCVVVYEFGRCDTMESHCGLMDLEHPILSNHKSSSIDLYDVLLCDIGYTIILREFLFPY